MPPPGKSLAGESLDMAAENLGLFRGIGETDRQLSERMSAVGYFYLTLHTEKPSPESSDVGRSYARVNVGMSPLWDTEYKPTTQIRVSNDPDRRRTSWARLLGPDPY